MSLLSMTQEIANKTIGTPASAITTATGSADQNIQQMVSAVNEAGRQLGSRHPWQALRNEATFQTVATTIQGSVLTLCGPDFNFVVNETMWDRSQRRPVFGPKSPAEWQQLMAQVMQGPWYQFTVRGNNILFLPTPPAGDNIYFEWCTKFWATDVTGVTGKSKMTADTDVAKIDEDLLILEGIWLFKSWKGLPYAADQTRSEKFFSDLTTRDGVAGRRALSGRQNDMQPGVLVPAGSWPIAGEPY